MKKADKMTTLIVEDKEENLYLLESLLKGNGYEILSALNGAEALKIAKKNKIDLIISDILMPVMDGFTFCRECKKDKNLKTIPFVFYTATYTDPKDEEFALNLGADRFILKPQEPDDFMKIIKGLLDDVNRKVIEPKPESDIPEKDLLKKYNASLIRKLEDKMQQTEESEKKLQLYVKELEDSLKEKEQFAKALKESEERFRLIYDNSMDAIILVADDGKIILANASACGLFKMKAEEFRGLNRNELIASFCHDKFETLLTERKATGKAQGELTLIRKNGSEFIAEVCTYTFTNSNGERRATLMIRDITQRKKSEEKIKFLAHSIESIKECVTITDKDNNILFVNDALLKTYGYNKNELIGKHIDILRPKSKYSMRHYEKILPETISGGWRGEIINCKKDGTEFPIHLSTSFIKDDNGELVALIGVATDITESKRIYEELIVAKEKAEKSDRVKTEFLAQMSHEIRSPLNAILNFTHLIKSEMGDTQEESMEIAFSAIDSASKRIIRTIDSILNMSELQLGTYSMCKSEIDLVEVLDNLAKEFKGIVKGKGLQLEFSSGFEEAAITSDDYALNQIFINLLDNAVKYTKKGKIEIKLYKGEKDNYCVDVRDTGIGISEEFLPDLFKPFSQEEQGYTRSFEGSGLGLALIKKYCMLINADICVKSKKNVGTTFTLVINTQA